jgi:predicted membrane channel-forming protein YqfA (hemolysin III family)
VFDIIGQRFKAVNETGIFITVFAWYFPNPELHKLVQFFFYLVQGVYVLPVLLDLVFLDQAVEYGLKVVVDKGCLEVGRNSFFQILV